MSDTNAKTSEKLNQIKYKLNKYVNLNENNKIKDYLNALKNIEKINLEILKETEIVDCLKSIKKKEPNSDTSKLADEIIKKWKSIVASNDSTNTKKSSSNIKEHQIKPQNQTNGHQNDKSNSTSNLNNGSFSNKKRIETKQDSESPDSKKPKLSLNDYKVKKENPTTTNGAKQNYVDKIPKQISCLSLSSSLSNSDKTSSSDLIVPLPTVPLSNILSSSNFNTSNNTSTSKITSLFSSLSSNVSAKANMFAENEDEALAKIMSTKHSKRTLYTGKSNMNGAKLVVPKLYDLCVKVLIPTLSSLHTRLSIQNQMNQFPVAFSLIKPVLEKADAEQLSVIEYYCPNLAEDTDYIWQKICEKEFKKCERPEEDENWKDLFYRKKDERDQALERVRNKISSKQANKPQERQTKIATVKFVSNGTSLKTSSSSTRTTSSAPVRQIIKDDSSKIGGSCGFGGSGVVRKPIQAPIMSKGMKDTMKLIKKNMRR